VVKKARAVRRRSATRKRAPKKQTQKKKSASPVRRTSKTRRKSAAGKGTKTARSVSRSADAAQVTVSIVGPERYSRGEVDGPEFLVVPANRYWAVEVAAEPALFAAVRNGASFDGTRFFATWQSGRRLFAPAASTVYRLPREPWNALWLNEALYYRVLTSIQESSWDGAIASAPPGKMDLFGTFARNTQTTIRPVEDLWRQA